MDAQYASRQLDKAIVAHFHEWQAGLAIPLCRKRHLDITTVFTTHATLLGRYLCAGSVDFYNNLQYFDVDHEAGKRGIYHRYCIERAATHCADVFTTVSHITAYESEHLLKRKPDGVVPNGLNVVKFQAMHEFQNLHAQSKAKINEFIRGHFYGHYDFDLENTLYVSYSHDSFSDTFLTVSLRCSPLDDTNTGTRVSTCSSNLLPVRHALSSIYSRMLTLLCRAEPPITEGRIQPYRRCVYHHARHHTLLHRRVSQRASRHQAAPRNRDRDPEPDRPETFRPRCAIPRVISSLDAARLLELIPLHDSDTKAIPAPEDLLSKEDEVLLKRRIFALKRNSLPPVVTHNVADDNGDPILNQIRRVKLFNNSHDRVKVIFHPDFLNASNPILGLDYEEFVRGCHLGVFPSYYEPWGYTPAECTVMGVPSVTTNLSGFGCFMQDLIERPQDEGCYIVDRRTASVEDSVNQLTDHMFTFCSKTRRQRINQRNRVERLSPLLDWKNLGIEYSKSRQLALRRAYPDAFYGPDGSGEEGDVEWDEGVERAILQSVPASPRLKGSATPGDLGTLTEEVSSEFCIVSVCFVLHLCRCKV